MPIQCDNRSKNSYELLQARWLGHRWNHFYISLYAYPMRFFQASWYYRARVSHHVLMDVTMLSLFCFYTPLTMQSPCFLQSTLRKWYPSFVWLFLMLFLTVRNTVLELLVWFWELLYTCISVLSSGEIRECTNSMATHMLSSSFHILQLENSFSAVNYDNVLHCQNLSVGDCSLGWRSFRYEMPVWPSLWPSLFSL